MPRIFAIIPAAGQGTRMGEAVPKQYIPVAGQPMMFHSIKALATVERIERVFVVLSALDRHWGQHDWSAFADKVEPVFAGGAHRADSVANALKHLEKKLGITMGETTPDGLFTLQQSECLGACADSPVMLVNDRTMCSFMSTDKLDQLIDGLRKAEGVQ